jgi:hypothetical protein
MAVESPQGIRRGSGSGGSGRGKKAGSAPAVDGLTGARGLTVAEKFKGAALATLTACRV